MAGGIRVIPGCQGRGSTVQPCIECHETLTQYPGFRIVRGYDPASGRWLHLKVATAPAPAGSLRLKQEFALLATLNHPNLVPPRSIGVLADGRPFVARDWVEGDSLRALVNRGPLAAPHVTATLDALLSLLSFLHARMLILREFALEDVLVERKQARLIDVRALDQLGLVSDGTITGSLACLAPEVALGGVLDGRTDLYVVGCLAYELLSGRPPFAGLCGLELLRAHVGQKPPPLGSLRPDAPPQLCAFVDKLLAKAPRHRFGSALEALDSLRRLSGAPLAAAQVVAPQGSLAAVELVGREMELEQIRRTVAEVSAGSSRALFIQGAAGMGKSRLLREVALQAQLAGMRVLWGFGRETLSVPYAPAAEALRPLLEVIPSARPLDRLFGWQEGMPVDPRREKLALFSAVTDWVRSAASTQPLALLFEDLHWADDATAELVDHLAHHLARSPVLIAVTYRPDELPGYSALRQCLNDGLAIVLDPRALDARQTAEMAHGMLGARVSQEILDILEKNAGGNPYFVAESLRCMVHFKQIDLVDGVWRLLVPPAEVFTAESVEAIVRRRLDRLPRSTRRLAGIAATIGEEPDLELLLEVAGVPEPALFDDLEILVRQLILWRRSNAYQFHHAKTRDAAYAALDAEERTRVHRAVALALERRRAPAAAVAQHYYAAGDRTPAVRFLLAAAEEALADDATRTAIEHLRKALEMELRAGEPDPKFSDHLRERIGRLSWLVDPQTTLTMLEEVLARCDPQSTHAAELKALMGSACSFLGRLPRAVELTAEAVARLGDHDSPERAALLVNEGIVSINRGRLDEAEAQFSRAREMFIRSGVRSSQMGWFAAYASNNVNMCRALRGEPIDPGLAAEAASLIHDYHFPDILSWHEYVYCTYAALTGHYRDFMEHHERAVRINTKMGRPAHNETLRLVNLALVLLERGELNAAEAALEQLLALTQKTGNQVFASYEEALRGRILVERGAVEEGHARVERAAQTARAGRFRYLARILAWLAEVEMARDRWEEAERALLEARQVSGPGPTRNPYQHIVATRLLVRVHRHHGRIAEGWRALSEATRDAELHGNLLQRAHLALEAAELCRAAGQSDDAAMHRGIAAALFRRIDNPLGLALVEGDDWLEARRKSGIVPIESLRTALESATARGVLAERLTALQEELDQALRQAKQARAVAEVGLLLARSLDVERVVDQACQQIHEVARCDRTVLRLLDAEGLCTATSERGASGEVVEEVVAEAMASGTLVQREEPAPPESRVQGWKPRSLLALPLRARERLVGVLYLERSPFQTPFDREDRAVIEAVGSYAAIAMENARLYSSLDQRARELEKALELHRTAERAARTDPLTGVANRRAFFEDLQRAVAVAARASRPLSLMMIDIDHFKRINDTFGHKAGDETLRRVARCLGAHIRTGDSLARIGGEEFVVLCQETDAGGAAALAERLRAEVATIPCPLDAPRWTVRISLGIASLKPHDTPDTLLERADAALYRAKARGRDRVEAG